MERLVACSVLLAAGRSVSAQAIYIPPDHFGENYKKSIGFWENKGQITNTQGKLAKDVRFYSEGGTPRAYLRDRSTVSFVMAHVDTNRATGMYILRADGKDCVKLWLGGEFYYAGTTPAWSISTWDGHHWCGLGGELNPTSYDFTFLHDTLYAINYLPFPAQDVHDVARYIGTGYADTCGVNVRIAEIHTTGNTLSLTQTADGQWQVSGLGQHRYVVMDALGRLVEEGSLHGGGTALIPAQGLNNGAYMVQIADDRAQRVVLAR